MTNGMENGNPKQGQIFLSAVQFRDDLSLHKIRPVIVVSNERAADFDVIAVSVSGQNPRSEFDVPIEYWKEAGLLKPSIARTSKLFTTHMRQLQKYLGTLEDSDRNQILQKSEPPHG